MSWFLYIYYDICTRHTKFVYIYIYIYISYYFTYAGPILEIGGMDEFFCRQICWRKGHIFGLHLSKQMLFLIISNENTFLETQGFRLGVIVTPNKGLELALIYVIYIFV